MFFNLFYKHLNKKCIFSWNLKTCRRIHDYPHPVAPTAHLDLSPAHPVYPAGQLDGVECL